MLKDGDKARAIADDYPTAGLSPRERAILDYARKLTLTPQDMTETDVERLRDAGLEDADVLDVCQVTSYYNYVNRLADGLGISLEDYWKVVPEL